MLIASIDILNGKAVQLKQGKKKILERDNPLELAKDFNVHGEIAVIDLDAAFEKGENEDLIRKICTIANCRVGGGIRDIQKAKRIFSFGADKIIISTIAFKDDKINEKFLQELKDELGTNKIIIAIDALKGEIVTNGWRHNTGINVYDAVAKLEKYCDSFLFTMVENEGCLSGIDLRAIKNLKTKNQITVAGGIKNTNEIIELSKEGYDVQVGMALYTGKIDIDRAFVESLDWQKQNLISTITQDDMGNVLMLAYSNKESLYKTLKTGRVTYYSRSRKSLWTKGDTSGNTQKFLTIRADCDRDTVLITADQTGNACHLDRYSCFGSQKFSLEKLCRIVSDKFANPTQGSYTQTLTDDKFLREKILEEAKEVCQATNYDNKIWEVADLLYFLSCYIVRENINLHQVFNELQRRNRR